MPWGMPRTSSPATRTSPALARSSPEIKASVVDLPQPVGPTTAQNSPGWTVRLRSRSAVYTPPDGVKNRFVTPRSSMAGVMHEGLSAESPAPATDAVVVAVLVVLVAGWPRGEGLRSRVAHT